MTRRLGLTEGQAYTAVIALVVATVLGVSGIPAVLRARPVRAATSPPVPRRSAPPAATTTPVVPVAPTAAIAAQRPLPLSSPGGGVLAAPALPPAITATPTLPALLTITSFAAIGSPGAPGGIAVANDGTVYVTTNNGTARGARGPSHVFAYDAKGALAADRVISGQRDDHVNGLTAAAVDPTSGRVVVVEPDAARILLVDTNSAITIPDLPACLISLGARPCEQGATDRAPLPAAVAFDRAGDLFVTDPSQDTIWRVPHGKTTPEVWYQSTFFATGDGPFGIAVDDTGVEFTAGTTLDPAAPTSGALYRVAFTSTSSGGTSSGGSGAGALTLVTSFPRGDAPGALTVGNSGTAYVVLRHPGSIVAIAPNGTQSWRIDPPASGPIPLDAPSGLALTAGQLLVTNQGSGADPTHWAVLAVSVNDGTRP